MNQYPDQYNKLLECIKEDSVEDKTDFAYRVDDRGVIIEKYFGDKTDLIIPSSIDGSPVYKIDEDAFHQDKKVTKVTFPNTLRIIGSGAFADSALEIAVLPNSLLVIEDFAFSCSALKSINIPDSVSIIGASAFVFTEIDFITIPKSIISIGEEAFAHTNLSSIRIPSNVKCISSEIFSGCKNLHTVIIEGAYIIKWAAFANCHNLKNISLPDSLAIIEDEALNRTGIKYLIIPQSVEFVGEYNFPHESHIAILSDATEIRLNNGDYSSVTLYCNQSNAKTRMISKEYGIMQKPLSSFAKESSDYYKSWANLDVDTMDIGAANKIFCEPNYCQKECEFYEACQGNADTCIKETFDRIISSLSPENEKTIRLIYGIGEAKETSTELIMRARGHTIHEITEWWENYSTNEVFVDSRPQPIDEFFKAKKNYALRKLRHPKRSRVLHSTVQDVY